MNNSVIDCIMTGNSGGSGGSDAAVRGDYRVRFIDYDGTILKTEFVDDGNNATAPDDPDYSALGLTFDGWNYSSFTGISSDLDVSPMISTDDGKSQFYLTLTAMSGYAPTIYFNKSDTSMLTLRLIDLSDDSVVWSTTNSSSGNQSETVSGVSTAGNYKLEMWISSGSGTYGFGNGNTTTTVVGGNTAVYRDILTQVFIGENVISIGDYALRACRSLKYITMPSGITSIGTYALYACDSIKHVGLSSGITSIPNYALSYNSSLETVSLPSGITSIGTYAFYNDYALNGLVVPYGVTSVGTYACYNCYALARLFLSNTVTSVGDYAFEYCWSLTEIHMSTAVQTIGTEAFSRCSIQEIVLPSTLTSLGGGAFYASRPLKSVTVEATTPPTIGGTNCFGDSTSILIIYVPSASLSAYQAATNWSTYANYMEAA